MLAALKKKKTPSVIVVSDDYSRNNSFTFENCPVFMIFLILWVILKKLSRLQRYPWFRLQKLSRFDDLEFPKAETFAKMTKERETRES